MKNAPEVVWYLFWLALGGVVAWRGVELMYEELLT